MQRWRVPAFVCLRVSKLWPTASENTKHNITPSLSATMLYHFICFISEHITHNISLAKRLLYVFNKPLLWVSHPSKAILFPFSSDPFFRNT